MFHLAAAIVIGLLAWRLIARFGVQRLMCWTTLALRRTALGVLVLLVLAVDVNLLGEVSESHPEWLIPLIVAQVFAVALFVRRRQQLQKQGPVPAASPPPEPTEHELVATLTAHGVPKVWAEEMAKDLPTWVTEFAREHGREPSKEEAIAWGRRWVEVARQKMAEAERETQRRQEAERRRQAEQEREAGKQRQRQREQAAKQSEEDKWWSVLEVSPYAVTDEIRGVYRRKIQQCHPDRVSGLAPEFLELAERRTKALNAAYAQAMHARRGT